MVGKKNIYRLMTIAGLLLTPLTYAFENYWNYQIDRSAKAKSLHTVESQDLYVETEFLNSFADMNSSARGLDSFRSNFMVSVADTTQFQMELESFREEDSDFLTTYLRYKQNIFSLGGLTVSLMPVLTVPTTGEYISQSQAKPGIALPFDFEINSEWRAGVTVQMEQMRDEDYARWQTSYLTNFFIGHKLLDSLEAYLELYDERTDNRDYDAYTTINALLQYRLTHNVLVSAGTYKDLNPEVSDYEHYLGVSYTY